MDVESAQYVAEVKQRQVFSLKQLETECLEIERVGEQKQKIGLVLVKRSAGKGKETPWLVCMTAAMFREMSGPLPTEKWTCRLRRSVSFRRRPFNSGCPIFAENPVEEKP